MPFLPDVPTRPPALDALAAALAGPLADVADDGAAHPWIPPELHVFGRLPRDGAVAGVVVPAPEVASPTWYVAEVHPTDGASGKVYASIRAGALAFVHRWAPTRLSAAARAACLDALTSVPEHRVGLPPDYVDLDGADGLPIWVPSWSWRAADVGALVPPEEVPRRIEDLVYAGRPGSALHLGRFMTHALVRHPDRRPLLAAVWSGLAAAYAALGRPGYAALATRRQGEGGLAPLAHVVGEVPPDGFSLLAALLAPDVPAFAGIRGARVAIGRPRWTRGPEEIAIHVAIGLDPTRSPEGADMAEAVVAQACDGAATSGPIVRRIHAIGRRLPADRPPPDPNDPAAVAADARGHVRLGGPIPLPDRSGDLAPFARWA